MIKCNQREEGSDEGWRKDQMLSTTGSQNQREGERKEFIQVIRGIVVSMVIE